MESTKTIAIDPAAGDSLTKLLGIGLTPEQAQQVIEVLSGPPPMWSPAPAAAAVAPVVCARPFQVKGPSAPCGRNDPCPCGSGKKYKACCLRGTLPGVASR